MAWRNRLAIVIFGVGAALSAVWAYSGVRSVLTELGLGGGSGIGAVSFGFGSLGLLELVEYVLPVIITFWLSARLRYRGRIEKISRQVHLVATLTLVAAIMLFLVSFLSEVFLRTHVFGRGMIDWSIFVGSFIGGVLWLPLQAFFAAGFLGLLIKGRSPIV
jgi:hypothetical protein